MCSECTVVCKDRDTFVIDANVPHSLRLAKLNSRTICCDNKFPIKLGPVSNGEFLPIPHSPFVHEVIRRTRALADDNARRLGVSRRQFLNGVTGAATMLFVLSAFAILFPTWFFRYARALWIAFDEHWDPWPNEEESRRMSTKETNGTHG